MIENKWSLRVAGGNAARLVIPPNDPDGVRIAIEKVLTKTSFDIQLNQPHLEVESSHPYTLRFRARADSSRGIFLGFAKAHEPWSSLGLYQELELTPEWKSFEVEFVATEADDDARIHFDVGGSEISVEFSSVTLLSLSDGKPVEPALGMNEAPVWFNIHRAIRRVKGWVSHRAIILIYHRIAESEIDPFSLCVTPHHFAEHLAVLQTYRCETVNELGQMHRRGKTPGRAVVITFDDGYVDNLVNAKPLLERHGIPATVFLITGYFGQEREFWWDELERLLLHPGTLPQTLGISLNGNTYEWKLGEAAYYSMEDYRRDRAKRAWEGNPGSRHSLYYSIWQLLQPLPEEDRRRVIGEIMAWAKAEPVIRPTHRPLLIEEAVALQQGGLIEIGAHTVTHSLLSAHAVNFQREEIERSKAYLEDILGHTVNSFSYPFGAYTPETVGLVREAGFMCACSTVPDVVRPDTDLMLLPRFEVQNWNGEEFERQLLRWLDG